MFRLRPAPEPRAPWVRAAASLRARRNPVRRRGPLGYLGMLDQRALRALRSRGHGPASDALMKTLGGIGEFGAAWVAIGLGAGALDRKRRARWLAAGGIAPAAVVVNYAVKLTVGRQRPLIEEHPPLARAPSKLSFPSAHATSSLAGATALGRVERRGRPAFYALAAGICLSRPYLGMHYPSDVLAGALLGAVLGALAPGLDAPGSEERLADLVAERRAPEPAARAQAPEAGG